MTTIASINTTTGETGEGCEDQNWINMPDGTTQNPGYSYFKNDYCDRCGSNSQGANFPVVWNHPSAPSGGWWYDPSNGTNYCQCCPNEGTGTSTGEVPCEDLIAQDPAAHAACCKKCKGKGMLQNDPCFAHCKCCKTKPKPTPKSKALREVKNSQLRKLIRESLINELSASNIISYFSQLTSDRGPSGVQVDDNVRADLIGLALPAIEQTSISSNNISTLISNLLILKDEYDTTDGKSLQQQPEEVQTAVEYLSSKEASTAFNEITDIEKSIAAALKAGADTLGGSTEKIYTASAFPDGMRDSDFYKKAVEDGYKFILKPYLNGRSAQTLPVGDDGFTLEEMKKAQLRKLTREAIKQLVKEENQMLEDEESLLKEFFACDCGLYGGSGTEVCLNTSGGCQTCCDNQQISTSDDERIATPTTNTPTRGKKAQLRKLTREAIKQLMTEQMGTTYTMSTIQDAINDINAGQQVNFRYAVCLDQATDNNYFDNSGGTWSGNQSGCSSMMLANASVNALTTPLVGLNVSLSDAANDSNSGYYDLVFGSNYYDPCNNACVNYVSPQSNSGGTTTNPAPLNPGCTDSSALNYDMYADGCPDVNGVVDVNDISCCMIQPGGGVTPTNVGLPMASNDIKRMKDLAFRGKRKR